MKIKAEKLSKSFDSLVLKNINLDEEITSLAVIGRSGCGKSTLLRILGGLIAPTEGKVYLDGDAVEESADYRKNIGFVFQQGGLFTHISARENIILPLEKVHNISRETAEERADELLLRFGLQDEGGKRPGQLSGGQKQRISIARAIAPKPKVLILDEPTSALDPEYTIEVLDTIKELKEEKLTFIIATHEMGFAIHACEKTAFMHDGTIWEFEKSAKLYSEPKTDELKRFLDKILEWRI